MSHPTPKSSDGKTLWLDDPRNVDKVVYSLYAICAGLFLSDLLYHKHVHFAAEGWIGFYAIYGLVGSVLLVLASKVMRVFLMRDEDYYGDDGDDETTRSDETEGRGAVGHNEEGSDHA